ncbi:MAG: hypothetical protein ACK5MI_09845 [Mangrovibacterium sp.]
MEIISQRDFELSKLASEKNLLEAKAKELKIKTKILERSKIKLEFEKEYLEDLVKKLLRMKFGASSERFTSIEYPNQLKLPFDIPEDTTFEK